MVDPTKIDRLQVLAINNQAHEQNGINSVANHPLNVHKWDILCGKNRRCVDHEGSRRFRAVIECHRERYQQALTKFDKTSVTRTIYDILSQSGSRFLRHDETMNLWEEISPMAARDKIGHALRFANRVSGQQRETNYASSEVVAKPAVEIPLSQLDPSPPPAQPGSLELPLKFQCLSDLPSQANLSRTSDLILGQAGRHTIFCSIDAPLIPGSDVQATTPLPLVECVAPYMDAQHGTQKKGTSSHLQDISPLHSFFDSMNNTTNLCDDDNPEGFNAFEQGDLTADWDFDAEILSVLL